MDTLQLLPPAKDIHVHFITATQYATTKFYDFIHKTLFRHHYLYMVVSCKAFYVLTSSF